MSSGVQVDFSSWSAATRDPAELVLGVPGYTYADLFDPAKLATLTEEFDRWFSARAPEAHAEFARYRDARGEGMTPQQASDALIAAAPHVSAFVQRLFGIEADAGVLRDAILADDPVWKLKKEFTKKRVFKADAGKAFLHGPEVAAAVAKAALVAMGADRALFGGGSDDEELAVAQGTLAIFEADDTARNAQKAGGARWTDELHARARAVRAALATEPSLAAAVAEVVAVTADPPTDADDSRVVAFALDALEAWLARRMRDHHDRAHRWPSLHAPAPLDHGNLVELRRPDPNLPEMFVGPDEHRRQRSDFELTDGRASRREVLAEIDYCLFCHDRDKDSCSKGLRDPKTGAYKSNALGVTLHGCPLDERISEMHAVRRSHGDALASLALICIDNPMLPGTGHRICNDCMKACIFQKQEPVNIPQIETATLTDVLGLPWGLEIYGLLTRWNPLDVRRPHPEPLRGKAALVVGMGPAGYTLAHHLSRAGFAVVGVDGLKIERLPAELTGDETRPPRPIRDFHTLQQGLDERIVLGFGGVSEYGITVRWDKSFLAVIYLTIARNRRIRVYGGVRFGGTLTMDDAFRLGFDHIGLAAGAGRPTLIDMKNNLARGVRKASDFLMALQLTGAYKPSSLANLQVRLPAVVIGGGLTAIDTGTEILAYYVVQAEKTASRFRTLVAEQGEAAVVSQFSAEDLEFLREQCAHADAIAEERARAAKEGRAPRFQRLLDGWGGVSIAYRKSLADSPAYRLNHEEVEKSLEEGVRYVENMSPVEAVLDERGAVRAVRFERQAQVEGRWRATGELVELPARTVCVAAGTSPNTTLEREHPGSFALDGRGQYFATHVARRADDGAVVLEPSKDTERAFFTSYERDGKTVSFYGDNHPYYAGSVVKAMASAKVGFETVAALYKVPLAHTEEEKVVRREHIASLFRRLDDELIARVHEVRRLTDTILEVVVRAPAAARRFEPGQFYRLQNFESRSPILEGTRLAMEGLALTGAWVDKEEGLLSTIVLEMGTSSRLTARLQPGEEVVLMGPTGTPTEIEGAGLVLLVGGGLGNAVLFSIAAALKAAGATVVYFAGYRRGEDVFHRDQIEASTDQVVWCTDSGAEIVPSRDDDAHVRGNIVQAMLAYAKGELGVARKDLQGTKRLIAIGSDKMMAAVARARHDVLAPFLSDDHVAIGSINSPMQCMMKEICAQCLQKHKDPETGAEYTVFSCTNQDQELDRVDWAHLSQRLQANTAEERLGSLWLSRLLNRDAKRRLEVL